MSLSLSPVTLFPTNGQSSQPGGPFHDAQTSEPGNTTDTSGVNTLGETSSSGTSDGGQNTGSGMSGGSSGTLAYTGWTGSRPPDADSESVVRAATEPQGLSADETRARAIHRAADVSGERLIGSLQDIQPTSEPVTDTDTGKTQKPTDVRV